MSDPIAFALNAQPRQFAAKAASNYNNSNNHEIQLNYEEIADLFENEQINDNGMNMNNMNAAPIMQMQQQHHIISDESGSGSSDSEDSFAFDSGLARPIGKKTPAAAAATKKAVPVSAARPLKKRGRRLSELVPREVTVSTTSASPSPINDVENSRRISIASQQEPVSPLATPYTTMQQQMAAQPMQMQQPNILTHQVYFQQRLNALMRQSQASLKALQDYDKSQGLPASHCATMVKSYRSRKQLLTGKILKKWDGTPLISFQTNADGSVTVHSGDKKERKKVVKKSSGKTSAAATN